MLIAQYMPEDLNEAEKKGVWDILCACDREFYPPLSARESSAQSKLNGCSAATAHPHAYFEEMLKQRFVLAFEKEEIGESFLRGFLTFRSPYLCDALTAFGESHYITTICVDPLHRRKGIMRCLYDTLERDALPFFAFKRVSTRTWSQNSGHIAMLEEMGFSLLATLENDRGAGVHTVYYGKDFA